MSHYDVFSYFYGVLQNHALLTPFLRRENVILGDRKHDDAMGAIYQVDLKPSSESEPRGERTNEAYRPSARPADPSHGGEVTVIYRTSVVLWCREPEPEIRLFGSPGDPRRPGILNFVSLVKQAIHENWNFNGHILALEFDAFNFAEDFPPPRAATVIITEENLMSANREHPEGFPPWYGGLENPPP